MDLAKARLEVAFSSLIYWISVFSFHDRDIAPEGDTLQETNQQLDIIIERMKITCSKAGSASMEHG